MPQFRNPFTGAVETLNQRAARIVRNNCLTMIMYQDLLKI